MGKFVQFIESVKIWSINPYNRCSHRCVYCISGSPGESAPYYTRDKVGEELKKAIQDIDPVMEMGVGAVSDAYPPIEAELNITREALIMLSSLKRKFCVNTKSDQVLRDMDILKYHQVHCDVYMSVASLNEKALKELEPFAPSVSRRLEAVMKLHAEGIAVGIDASPWIPGISCAAALRKAVPIAIPIQFTPLDIQWIDWLRTSLNFTQEEIDRAYAEEKNKNTSMKNVTWH